MKKILFAGFIFIMFLCLSNEAFAINNINFVYVNGSNTNDKKMENWYRKGVKKLHPKLKKTFDNDEFAKHYFLDHGKYEIHPEPTMYYWGDKSQEELSFVEKDLELSKMFSSSGAFIVRSMVTKFLHDAIWVQKYHNMHTILDELQIIIKENAKNNDKVVLFGYSAGSFVTYQYLLNRLPYINPYDFFKKVGATEEELAFIKQNPMKNTCIEALGTSKLAVASIDGHVIPNKNTELFKQNYTQLNYQTQEVCAPPDTIEGIVNFATPLILFYSDISEPDYQLSHYTKLLYEYIIENDKFWITVNFREDPLGFPCGRNLSVEELETVTDMDIDPHKGFVFDHSNTISFRPVFLAHTSYWSAKNAFAKALIKSYKKGYTYHHDDFYKNKTK